MTGTAPWAFKHKGRNFRVLPDARIEKLTFDNAGVPVWKNTLVTPALALAATAKSARQ